MYSFFLEEANAVEANSTSIAETNNSTVSTSTKASPAASHGSASSEHYPSQSDEDIDRLVALHQHRQNSLSSLGVSKTYRINNIYIDFYLYDFI